jgi:hypothetical protein
MLHFLFQVFETLLLPLLVASAKTGLIYSDDGTIHIHLRERLVDNEPHKIIPNFLGIGGAKSGSTSMIYALDRYDDIVRGRRSDGNPELYALMDTKTQLLKDKYSTLSVLGAGIYDDFFIKRFHGATYGEKTPIYACASMIPYRTRAIFGGDIKFIYTYRDPVEMDISLFLMHYGKNGNISYLTWVSHLVEKFESWQNCRETKFAQMLLPPLRNSTPHQWAKLSDIYDIEKFSVSDTAAIEAYLVKTCGLGDISRFSALHTHNLRRWNHAFSEYHFRNMTICVTNEEQKCREGVYDEVHEFVTGHKGKLDTPKKKNFHREEVVERLVKYFQKNRLPWSDAEKALKLVRPFYRREEDPKFVQSFCPTMHYVCPASPAI